jgi:hypothetical protein
MATSSVHYTTSCNTQSSAPEDGQNNCPKHVGLTGIINKPLLLHLVVCLYYLYELCTVKQISDNEIYLLIKYIKSVLWRVAKRLSYVEDARCLKVKEMLWWYGPASISPELDCRRYGNGPSVSVKVVSFWQLIRLFQKPPSPSSLLYCSPYFLN